MNNDNADPPKKLSKQASLSYLEKSLSMISTPQEAPVTIYPGPNPKLINLSKADLEIADRLQKLRRKSNQDVPSEEEMAVRLAQLKGLPMDHYTKSPSYKPPDSRNQIEKADDLFAQVAAEVSLEAKCASSSEKSIEERLSCLRAGNSKTSECSKADQNPYLSSLDKEDIDFEEITKMAAEEQNEALKEVKSLNEDAELAAVIAEACKELKSEKAKKQRKKQRRHPTDEERFSASDSENSIDKDLNAEDQEEVERIVEMYKEKARIKSERKKKHKLGIKNENSDSSSLSSESDILTSESEKLSNDDSD